MQTLLILCTFPLFISSKDIAIRKLQDEPLLLLEIKDTGIQTGYIKVIHPINLTEIEKTIDSLHTTFYQTIDRDSGFFLTIKHKIQDIHFSISQIKPNRHRRWDALGSAWKWLAGNPDADDLWIMNSTFNELINQHNVQYHFNEATNHRFNQLTRSINTLIEANQQAVNDSIDMAAMKLLVNINIIDGVLRNLQDAILGTKIGLPSNRFLTIDELDLIASILKQQGINIDMLEEVFNFVEPKMAMKDNQILYILQIPQIDNNKATILEIIPLPIRNQTIINNQKILVKHKHQFFTTTAPNSLIQKFTDLSPFDDKCIKPLLLSIQGICDTKLQINFTIQPVAEGKILVLNAKHQTLYSNCGNNNKTLNGNLLVTIENCEMIIANQTYKATTVSQKKDVPNLFYGTLI